MAEVLASTLAPSADGPPPSAKHPPVDRERLLGAMIDLCETGHADESAQTHAMMEGIFLDIIKRAERDIRLRMADRLATAPWAPSGLINALALDDIDIARPIIAKSPVLQDRDLIRLLTVATIEHQIEVARRPDLGDDVVKAILDRADPVVLTTLASNVSADISYVSMARLVAASRRIAAIRTPLSRHPRLNLDLACVLYAWVGDTLKADIAERFQTDRAELDKITEQSVAEALAGAPSPDWQGERLETLDQNEMETRLVAKLEAADQLKPGFLLRALREGKLHLFTVAMASLASVKTEEVIAAANGSRPELLALACASVGIDRSVFPTILSLVRALNESRPQASPDSLRKIAAAFSQREEGEALAAFRAGVADLSSAASPAV
jgi:uncharacterized protein (DUF2336 family)